MSSKKTRKNPPISPNLSNIASRCGQGQLGTMRSFRLRKSWGQHISSPGNPGARRCFLHISGWGWIPVDTKKKHYYNRLQHFWGGRISRDHISIYIYLSIDLSTYLHLYLSIYLFGCFQPGIPWVPMAPFSGRQAMRQRRHHRQDGKIMAM